MADLIFIIVLGTSIWVFIDARSLKLPKKDAKGFWAMGPIGWLFACFLIWIVAFPVYLVKRSEWKNMTDSDPCEKDTGNTDYLAKLERLGEMKTKGILTEEEFNKQKTALLEKINKS